MTEQKQAFDKLELKALFRELLKPYATMIPEIGNQENAFNDAIPYLHRIFIGNTNYDWNLKELFYEFEDQIDVAPDKAAEARRVFVLLLKIYILLEYMNNPYRLSLQNPFGPLCGKIDEFAKTVKQKCKDNIVDKIFVEFTERVYEDNDPTGWCFSNFIGNKIVNLPEWDNGRFYLLTMPYKESVVQSTMDPSTPKSVDKTEMVDNMKYAELLSKVNDLNNEIERLKNENDKLNNQIDECFNDNEREENDNFHIDYRAKTELIYNLLNKAGVNVTNSQAVAHLCVLLTGYERPRTIYNFILDIIKGNKKSNKNYWHDIDRINSALIEGLSSNALIIQKRDSNGNVDSMPDKHIYQDDIEKMRFRQR
ncbi:MAG: hypothetical protein ACI3Y0_11255 [Prevotella sp.]